MGDGTVTMDKSNLVREDLRGHSPAYNLDFNEKIRAMRENGHEIYHFGFGQSPFQPMKEMISALQENAHQNAYLNVAGLPELRQAIADFHTRYDCVTFQAENVLVGPGSKELIYLLMNIFSGDILVTNPTWPTYKPQARLANRTAYVVTTTFEDEWRVTSRALNQAIKSNNLDANRPKLLIFCNPDNPTGTHYQDHHLKEFSEECRRNNIIVVSDEIYGRLHYEGKHQTLSKYYPEGTILSSGFSKWASAGGWRVGYHIFPSNLKDLRDAVRSASSQTYSCAPAPMQYALAQSLPQEEACDNYIRHTTRIMKAVAEYCYRELTEVGVKCVKPQAGYYCFPDFEVCRKGFAARGITTGAQMCDAMLKECNVALMSGGPAFLRPADEFTVRFCYVNFCGDTALEESMRIGLQKPLPTDFVEKSAAPVHHGVQALKKWVQQHIEH